MVGEIFPESWDNSSIMDVSKISKIRKNLKYYIQMMIDPTFRNNYSIIYKNHELERVGLDLNNREKDFIRIFDRYSHRLMVRVVTN